MLDDIRNEKISNAEQWKQYQLQNINNMFEAERQQAEEECRVCFFVHFFRKTILIYRSTTFD